MNAWTGCPVDQSKGHTCSGVSTKSDFMSHLCSWVPLCPFCLPFLSTFTPPLFCFPLMLILLALSEWLLCPRHPAGPGVCVNNTQSCQFVLPDVGGTERRDEASSALREVRAVGSQGGSSLAGANLEAGRPDRRSALTGRCFSLSLKNRS